MRISFVLVITLAGCVVSIPETENLLVSCAGNEDCPSGLICRQPIGRCVDVSEPTAEIEVVRATVFPLTVGPGTQVNATVEFSSAPPVPPTLRAILGEQAFEVELESTGFREFRGTFEMPDQSNTPSFTVTLTVSALGTGGSPSVFTLPSLTADYVPPGIDTIEWFDALAGPASLASFSTTGEVGTSVAEAFLIDQSDRVLGPVAASVFSLDGLSAELRGSADLSMVDLDSVIAVRVRVVVVDSVGNRTEAVSEALPIDSEPPETVLDSTPPVEADRLLASFSFSSPNPDTASFVCALDDEPFTLCQSPVERLLSVDGPHRFEVAAVDASGTPDPTPASFSWTETRRWSARSAAGHVVSSEGGLWSWGTNQRGRLGTGTIGGRERELVRVRPERGWVTAARSLTSACGIREDGELWCWGIGSLGNGTSVDAQSPFPVQTVEPGPWVAIDVKDGTACGVKANGELYCWGRNARGQVGNATTQGEAAPVRIGSMGGWRNVRIGGESTCAVRDAPIGTEAYCWGETHAAGTQLLPTIVAGDDWRVIQPYSTITCGVREPGTLWCWGEFVATDDGSDFNSPTPVQIDPNSDWASIDGASLQTCAMRTDGRLFCFGDVPRGVTDERGAFRTMTPTRAFPGEVFASFELGSDQLVCGLTPKYTLLCSGLANELPQGLPRVRTSGLAIADLDAHDFVTCGRGSSGDLLCWGSSVSRSLRQRGDVVDQPMPVWNVPYVDAVVVSSGGCVIPDADPASRQLQCWGIFIDGSFAFDDPTVPTGGPGQWFAVEGNDNFSPSFCALRQDPGGATLHCWGSNPNGILALGDFSSRASPTAVGAGQPYEFGWSDVRLGESYGCGIRNGELWCWGQNSFGVLGNGTKDLSSLPVRSGDANDWQRVSTGLRTACGIREVTPGVGTLWCWGSGALGALAAPSFDSSNVPLQIGDDSDWTDVAVRRSTVCAVKSEGSVWCWGNNEYRQAIPDDPSVVTFGPTRVPGVDGAIEVALNRQSSCARSSSQLFCWGNEIFGGLGGGAAFGPLTIELPPLP
ncbi:MAG: hypothetical protein AAF654_05575 [Myxococcota bacterium]